MIDLHDSRRSLSVLLVFGFIETSWRCVFEMLLSNHNSIIITGSRVYLACHPFRFSRLFIESPHSPGQLCASSCPDIPPINSSFPFGPLACETQINLRNIMRWFLGKSWDHQEWQRKMSLFIGDVIEIDCGGAGLKADAWLICKFMTVYRSLKLEPRQQHWNPAISTTFPFDSRNFFIEKSFAWHSCWSLCSF